MEALVGPYLVAALVLALGGILKALRPAGTAGALRQAGLPVSQDLVRVGGIVEVGLSIVAVVAVGPVPAILIALSYAGFGAFVVAALRGGTPLSSCGCFGEIDTPPGWGHVVVDLAFAAIAVGWAVQRRPDVLRALSTQPGAGLPAILLVVVVAGLVYLILTELPRTRSLAVRQGRP